MPANKIITLYARFVTRQLSVKLHYSDAITQTVTAEYGDLLSDIVPFRDIDGKMVSAWSTEQNDTALTHKFEGAVKTELELYAARYSTYIAFETDGGDKLAPVCGVVGASVTLPTPVKKGSAFLGWKLNDGGELLNSTATLGETGVTLTAVWRAFKVTLNADGAANVPSEVTAESGGIARLPVPAKPNYVFAGWFDASQAFYWDSVQISSDMALTAKWVESRVSTETNKWSEEYNGGIPNGTLSESSRSWTKTETYALPAELMPAISMGKVNVKVTLKLKVWVRTKGNATATVKIDATVNNSSKDGPTMSAKGGGYNGFLNTNPVDGPIEPEVRSTLEFSFKAPASGNIPVKLVYDMRSNKDNSLVTTDVHFLCEELTVEISNV